MEEVVEEKEAIVEETESELDDSEIDDMLENRLLKELGKRYKKRKGAVEIENKELEDHLILELNKRNEKRKKSKNIFI